MNRKILVYGRRLLLSLFVLAAGCFCSCGRRESISLVQESAAREAGQEQDSTALTDGAEASEDTAEGAAGREDEAESDANREEGAADRKNRDESTADRENRDESRADEAVSEMVPERASCFVHVCGEVVQPGVYELLEGQRVYEAVGLAGGFTEQAASGWLNLAEPVRDGMKVEVPSRSQAEKLAERLGIGLGADGSTGLGSTGLEGSGTAPGAAAGADVLSAKVNINTATKEELMTLRGIGEARAEDIIRYRESYGGFQKIEDIMKVSGIKDAAFQKIKEDITV